MQFNHLNILFSFYKSVIWKIINSSFIGIFFFEFNSILREKKIPKKFANESKNTWMKFHIFLQEHDMENYKTFVNHFKSVQSTAFQTKKLLSKSVESPTRAPAIQFRCLPNNKKWKLKYLNIFYKSMIWKIPNNSLITFKIYN